MPRQCKICEVNPAADNSEYCAECKNPKEIRGICKKCGNRFQLQPDELQDILNNSGAGHVTPKLGQTVVVSNCVICEDPEEKNTITVYE